MLQLIIYLMEITFMFISKEQTVPIRNWEVCCVEVKER